MKKKILIPALAAVLAISCVIGGTIAWLTDKTETIDNTFTVGDININLAETTKEYKMVPGCTIEKDPKVTVEANSEKSYVFVKVEESSNFDDFMTYAMAEGWTELTEGSGVYYRVVDTSAMAQEFPVLADNKVTVKEEVTKAMLDALIPATYPKLSFTAYAVQYFNGEDSTGQTHFTPEGAWAQVNPESAP